MACMTWRRAGFQGWAAGLGLGRAGRKEVLTWKVVSGPGRCTLQASDTRKPTSSHHTLLTLLLLRTTDLSRFACILPSALASKTLLCYGWLSRPEPNPLAHTTPVRRDYFSVFLLTRGMLNLTRSFSAKAIQYSSCTSRKANSILRVVDPDTPHANLTMAKSVSTAETMSKADHGRSPLRKAILLNRTWGIPPRTTKSGWQGLLLRIK